MLGQIIGLKHIKPRYTQKEDMKTQKALLRRRVPLGEERRVKETNRVGNK